MSHYIATDLHGEYKLWERIRDYLKPNDVLYFLGDAADRGPDGLKIMRELLSNPRVVYLKGNHEELLINTIKEWLDLSSCSDYPHKRQSAQSLHLANGGQATQEDLLPGSHIEWEWYLRQLENLPEIITVTSQNTGKIVCLSHAGCDPIDIGNNTFKNKFNQPLHDKDGPNLWLWNREHLIQPWPQESRFENLYIIHGHTPVPALGYISCIDYPDPDKTKEIFIYADGHKIDLDLLSFQTKKAVLYNLDNMEVEKYFNE